MCCNDTNYQQYLQQERQQVDQSWSLRHNINQFSESGTTLKSETKQKTKIKKKNEITLTHETKNNAKGIENVL